MKKKNFLQSLKEFCGETKKGEIAGHRIPNFAKFDYEEAPAYHLIDVEKYRSKNNVVAYFKTRGCPFKCTFCATGNFNTSHKLPSQYHREIKYLLDDLKFDNLCFRDPTFFLKASVVMDCAELIHNLGVKKNGKVKQEELFIDNIHQSNLNL